ncbi:hypothetical protein C9994_00195 [Marivirga lumbricoides]|uniref:Uncharacterized protein n=1 Tax=Marivirga lumbricoides TaxID=1046115 RepID=A0A2T4DW22_9BACT|nr:hypothetical protein C9994_00195 [Marivirga lumbricoides]
MASKHYQRTAESFVIFANVDSTILKINPYIQKYGFEFRNYNLSELESIFSGLFLPKEELDFPSKTDCHIVDIDISLRFYQALNSNPTGHHLLQNNKALMLQNLKVHEFNMNELNTELQNLSILHAKTMLFSRKLLFSLRLHYDGDVAIITDFTKALPHNEILFRTTGLQFIGRSPLKFSDESLIQDPDSYQLDNSKQDYLKLSEEKFNLSYEFHNVSTKYLTLITCLECLFNHGKDQITHTISKHLALILSEKKEDFQKNYQRIKKLYRVRSTITHGSQVKENMHELTNDLREKVRYAIIYCRQLNKSKKELFEYLKEKGFNS